MKKFFTLSAGHATTDSVDVDALLAAINEISESEVKRAGDDDNPNRVSLGGHGYYSWSELAEAFELDVHDFSSSEFHH